MSFKSILLTIGLDALKVVGVASQVAQTVPMINMFLGPVLSPAALALEQSITKWVNMAEVIIQTAKSGAQRKDSVVTILKAEIPNMEAVIAALGHGVVMTPEAETALAAAIDHSVGLKNSISTLLDALHQGQK